MSKNKNDGEVERSLSESYLFGSSLCESSQSESSLSESSDAEASNEDVTNREKSGQLDSSGAIMTKGPTGHNQASANTPLNVTEKDKVGSNSISCAAMQSHMEESKNKNKNSTGTNQDTITPHCQEVAPSAVKSKKKKKKRKRKKTVPATLGTQTPASVRNEGESKLRSPDTCLGNPHIQQLIASRISDIESGKAEAKAIEYKRKYQVIKSPSLIEKQKTTSSAGTRKLSARLDDLIHYDEFKIENDKMIPIKKGCTISLPKAVLSPGKSQASSANLHPNKVEKDNVKSKSTSHTKEARNKNENATGEVNDEFRAMQIALPEDIPKGKSREKSVPESSETESISSAKYEGVQIHCSNTFLEKENGANNSIRPVIFVNDKSTQTDPLQESPLSSEHYHSRNILAQNLDSDCTVEADETEADTLFPPAKSNLENVSEDIDNSMKFCSTSKDENLLSIKEDFLTELKIASESFVESYIKCFQDAN